MNHHVERMIEIMKRRKLLFFSLILATLAVGVVIGTVINRSVNADRPGGIAPGATAIAIPCPTQLSSEFSKIAKLAEPAVVNINTETIVKSQRDRRRTPFGRQQEEPFDFFERFFGGPMEAPRDMKQRALGSGFIVDK